MESTNSSPLDPQASVEAAPSPKTSFSEQSFADRFESLLPRIQERWPDVAKQTLEATRGSFDEMVRVLSDQSSNSSTNRVREQLEELIETAGERTRDFADSLEPLEKRLEELLDDLNTTLRPRIERPVRARPLLALCVACGIGLFAGIILSGGRRS
ncbi:hypothetical protein [Prochlorococcus sp. MIT 1341]|uniref:hypothetical protein n=1 Tax=Prochlorococcus sp. MIT 1341 TaxID=3096221 RepID=UPI002A74A8DA|nr:hypothetical protein [Prochlorococcus sp. MIT 1341]